MSQALHGGVSRLRALCAADAASCAAEAAEEVLAAQLAFFSKLSFAHLAVKLAFLSKWSFAHFPQTKSAMAAAAAGGRKRDWCITVHAGHWGDYESEAAVMDRMSTTTCEYLVFQQETGAAREGGVQRDHLQGYVMFKQAKTLQAAQTALGVSCHLEPRRAAKISAAIKYCKKAETRREGCNFFEKGEMPMDHGVKRGLAAACALAAQKDGGAKRVARDMPEEYAKYHRGLEKIEQIAAGDRLPTWRDVKVIVVVGDSGCGKSYFAEHYDEREHTYPMGDSDPVWVDGYNNERTIVIEEFAAAMPFRFLLRLLDGYRLNMPSKGGFIWGQHTTVILTSNIPPDRWYNNADNQWSFDTSAVAAGPLQRRIHSIHTGTGVYKNGTAAWDIALPTRVPMVLVGVGDMLQMDEIVPDVDLTDIDIDDLLGDFLDV